MMKILVFIILNSFIVFNSFSQGIKSSSIENGHASSIINFGNNLLASVTYKVNLNQYCKVYLSGNCGDTWTEVYKTNQYSHIKMFSYKEKVYFLSQTNDNIRINSTVDTFKTITTNEIPELKTRIVYDFYVFDDNTILLAYNKGIGLYQNGIFQPINLNKFGKYGSFQIKFYGGNVFVNFGESILISQDTCRTWKKYVEIHNNNCGSNKDIYYYEINAFDFLNNILVINSGNADCFAMYYCDTAKRESLKKIESLSVHEWSRPVVIEDKIYGLPLYGGEKDIYYLNEDFVPVYVHSGLPSSSGQNTVSLLKIIGCNKSIIICTSDGIYKLKIFE